ncbi:MAG: TatD family hydrolase [Candidatus Eremiobacteraeota bacterium]|nr:TatD family hydrolase [Candidatus Eremiobacteraeota bacterium]
MIDTHAHVHDRAFDDDRDEAVARARAAGIQEVITVGCDLADSGRALQCARTYRLYASAGIHPHEAKEAPADIEAAFAPLLEDARIVAIGETGLDYYYDHSPREAQIACLRAQIRLAKAHEYPVIFHHRDAFDDFTRVLSEEFKAGMRGVIHCFTGTAQQAQVYVNDYGLKLGIGGVITFKSAQAVRDAVQSVGVEHCILETDCPYLAPVPHRGKRNEPAFVLDTAAALATLLDETVERIGAVTDATARSLFSLGSK